MPVITKPVVVSGWWDKKHSVRWREAQGLIHGLSFRVKSWVPTLEDRWKVVCCKAQRHSVHDGRIAIQILGRHMEWIGFLACPGHHYKETTQGSCFRNHFNQYWLIIISIKCDLRILLKLIPAGKTYSSNWTALHYRCYFPHGEKDGFLHWKQQLFSTESYFFSREILSIYIPGSQWCFLGI